MKKGLIELRTGQVYISGPFKEEYADEVINEGFDVDYESFDVDYTEKTETIPIDFLKDLITEYENGTNCEKLWAVGLTCAIQKYKAQKKREK